MFFTDGKLRGLEKFMQLPKYPTKKGGGRYRSSYEYTKGDCNCVNCLHWKKKYGCSQKVCPYIQERIDCGACSFDEIFHVAFIDVSNKKLKSRINLYVKESKAMDNSIELQIRIAEIDAEFSKLITSTNTENENDDDRETLMEKLLTEKNQLKKQLEEIELLKKNKELTMSRLDEIYSTIDLLRNHPLTYDDQIVREILECVVVESKDKIKVVFKVGIEIVVQLLN